MRERKWSVMPKMPANLREQYPEIPEIVLQLLFNRDVLKEENIDDFLSPDYERHVHDPYLFSDMKKVVNRIYKAIEKKEKIVVHGDYDADGVTSSTILKDTISDLGGEVTVFLPHRETDGYGLNMNTVELLAKEKTNLLITTDCGISNEPEITKAKKLGMDVIVIDHHHVPEKIPKCLIIHPQVEEKYPFKYLCAGGVAFKVATALAQDKRSTLPVGYEKWLLDLVAIATVADVVPLVDENRVFLKYGLIVLNKTKRVGLKKLIENSRPRRNYLNMLTSESIMFQVSPRINAAGRIAHANAAYELLQAKTENKASRLAKDLEKTNSARQRMAEKMVKEAMEQIKPQVENKQKVLFAIGDEWPIGLVGLVAGRIMDQYFLPTFVITKANDRIGGSGRSIPYLSIIETMDEIPHCFDRYGGHDMAAGFVVKDEEHLQCFQEEFLKLAKKKLAKKDLRPTLNIDAKIDFKDVTWTLLDQLEQFEPFGEQNPFPRFLAEDLEVVKVDTVGNGKKHLRLVVKHKGEVIKKTIGFGFGEMIKELKPKDKVKLVFEIGVNQWNGERELQLKIVDMKKQ